MGKDNGKRNGNGKRHGKRRPVEWVKHPDSGEDVTGLRSHRGQGLYYRIDPKGPGDDRAKNVYYPTRGLRGVDYLRRAIYEHDLWQKGLTPPTHDGVIVTDKIPGERYHGVYDDDGNYHEFTALSRKDLCRWLRDELSDPQRRQQLAQDVGYPELAYLDRITPSSLSLTLKTIGDNYVNKTPPLTTNTKGYSRRYWNEFVTTVGVDRVSELTAQHFRTYRDTINTTRQTHEHSPTYVRQRFIVVKSVIRHAATEGEDTENIGRVLTLCKMLKPPKRSDPDPTPISVTDYHLLLDKADTKWKAILLIALNCGFYPTDVATLRKDHIDLTAGTLFNKRTKTGVPRIAVLWTRTVDAINKYLTEHPHDGDTVFVNEWSRPYDGNHIGRGFRKLRGKKRANVPHVEFNHIRDASETVPTSRMIPPQQVDWLMGHKTGTRDEYLRRAPYMVSDCCAAIEQHFFPTSTVTTDTVTTTTTMTTGEGDKGDGRKRHKGDPTPF